MIWNTRHTRHLSRIVKNSNVKGRPWGKATEMAFVSIFTPILENLAKNLNHKSKCEGKSSNDLKPIFQNYWKASRDTWSRRCTHKRNNTLIILVVNPFIFLMDQYTPVRRRIHIKESYLETTFVRKYRGSCWNGKIHPRDKYLLSIFDSLWALLPSFEKLICWSKYKWWSYKSDA